MSVRRLSRRDYALALVRSGKWACGLLRFGCVGYRKGTRKKRAPGPQIIEVSAKWGLLRLAKKDLEARTASLSPIQSKRKGDGAMGLSGERCCARPRRRCTGSLRRPLVLAGRCAASCQIVGSSLLVFFAARLSSVALPPRASLAGVAAQCARALPVAPLLGATDVAAFSALSDRPGRRGLFLLRRTNTFCYHKIFCPVLATISRLRQWVPDRATIDAVWADEGCRVALVKEGRARDGA